MLILAWAITAVVLVVVADLLIGARRIRNLAAVDPLDSGPPLSIIVAARNEEAGIEAGVRSLLTVAYAPLEVMVVNDRSTDRTGDILRRIQREDPRLIVMDVTELAPGWLGKNHALAFGAARARGAFLLFTDADVIFDPTVVGRAVRVMESDALDLLAAFPRVHVTGVALRTLVLTFGVLFAIHMRPWKARDPDSDRHIGIGAFNLMRAAAYRQMGTHAAIALRPDDDVRLARAAKAAGLVQDIVRANTLLEVEWYGSVREMVNGLMKNAFAGLNYSVAGLCIATLGLLAFGVWPWVGAITASGGVRAAALTAVAAMSLVVAAHSRASGASVFYALLYPAGVLGFVYILWRSAALALARGSITWRETSYPLRELKQSRPAQPLRAAPRE